MRVWGFVGGSHYADRDGVGPAAGGRCRSCVSPYARDRMKRCCLDRSTAAGGRGSWRPCPDGDRSAPGRCRARRLALLHRRPYPGRDRQEAERRARRRSAWSRLCLSERLITFRLEHPIAACMELARRLKDQVRAPLLRSGTDRSSPTHRMSRALAERAAALLEQTLRAEKPTHHRHRHRPRHARRGRTDWRRWIAPTTRSSRWSATSRPTARRASSIPWRGWPISPRRGTTRCRSPSSSPRSRARTVAAHRRGNPRARHRREC